MFLHHCLARAHTLTVVQGGGVRLRHVESVFPLQVTAGTAQRIRGSALQVCTCGSTGKHADGQNQQLLLLLLQEGFQEGFQRPNGFF